MHVYCTWNSNFFFHSCLHIAQSSEMGFDFSLQILKLVTAMAFENDDEKSIISKLDEQTTWKCRNVFRYSLFAFTTATAKCRWICKCHRYTIQCCCCFFYNWIALRFCLCYWLNSTMIDMNRKEEKNHFNEHLNENPKTQFLFLYTMLEIGSFSFFSVNIGTYTVHQIDPLRWNPKHGKLIENIQWYQIQCATNQWKWN